MPSQHDPSTLRDWFAKHPPIMGGDPEGDPPTADPPSDTPPGDPPDETGKTVPLAALERERKARQDLERKLAKAEADQEERRKAEMSEVERHKAEAEEAKAKAAQLEDRITRQEREQWLRAAASAAGFIDPDDAIARIGTADLDDERAAKTAVKDLAAKAKHLVGKREDARPDLHKVLEDGKRTPNNGTPDKDAPAKYTPDEIRGMSAEQIAADLDEVNRSLAIAG